MYDVIVTPSVEEQVREATNYIAYELWDPDAADRLALLITGMARTIELSIE